MTTHKTSWFGDRAVVIDVSSPIDRELVATTVMRALPEAVVRRGISSLMVEVLSPDINLEADVRRVLASVDGSPKASHAPETSQAPATDATITIDVDYDGPDLVPTATFFGLLRHRIGPGTHLAAVARGTDWLRSRFRLPRTDRGSPPALVLPATTNNASGDGSRGQCGPRGRNERHLPDGLPGGWHLIGTSRRTLFDPHNDSRPTLLVPGATVRFAAINHEPTP